MEGLLVQMVVILYSSTEHSSMCCNKTTKQNKTKFFHSSGGNTDKRKFSENYQNPMNISLLQKWGCILGWEAAEQKMEHSLAMLPWYVCQASKAAVVSQEGAVITGTAFHFFS